MLSRARPVLNRTGEPRKRKEMETGPIPPGKAKGVAATAGVGPSNQILAGYLAHEFLTKGTLLGEEWDAARPELAATLPAPKRPNQTRPGSAKPKPNGYKPPPPASSYADVAQLLKGDGAHIPEVVNPTQLGQWLIKM